MDNIIFSTPWLSVKQTPRNFYYLERKGKDSVGIFLIRKVDRAYEVLIRQQPLCIDNTEVNHTLPLYPCPITGSLDGDEAPAAAAVREVYEEAGYPVTVLPLGHYIVGTQTNEICYLYYADVTDLKPDIAPQDGSFFESISKNEWHPFEYLQDCNYAGCQIGYYRLREILQYT
jgi:8-oxo-dGTP diphosphatase